jgi:hypothetical protein
VDAGVAGFADHKGLAAPRSHDLRPFGLRLSRLVEVGKLTRQGSAPLRWALFEAAQSASHRTSPGYHDYHALKARQEVLQLVDLTEHHRIHRALKDRIALATDTRPRGESVIAGDDQARVGE